MITADVCPLWHCAYMHVDASNQQTLQRCFYLLMIPMEVVNLYFFTIAAFW